MRRFAATACLAFFFLFIVYSLEFILIRTRLHHEEKRFYKMVESVQDENVEAGVLYKVFNESTDRVELVPNVSPPHGLRRLTQEALSVPPAIGVGPGPMVVLRYKMGFWTHVRLFFLTWVLVIVFLRMLKGKPLKFGERERQLQEELAYLSKTYQSLSKSLRMERQKVETILNSAPDGIFTCSPDGIVTFWNRSMEALTTIPKEAAVGKHYRESMTIFSVSGQLLADPFSSTLIEDQKLNLMDCQLEALDPGERRGNSNVESNLVVPVAVGAASVSFTPGSVDEIVITVKDIRLQKEAEKIRRDMQAMITHDLRSPLSAMLGYAGLIKNAKICKNEEDAVKYLDSLVRAGKEMLILISNLLGWSWIEEGKLSFRKESLSILPILRETVESLEVLAKPKNLSIVMNAPEDIWALTDGDKLKEVLNNLMTNAVKFSRPSGTITVSAFEEGDKVRISVADQGVGISPEEKEKLFQKFSTPNRKQGAGTGLGLYIVKTLIEALDGTVKVESEVGRGSTFTLTLPAVQKVTTHVQQLSLLSLVKTEE